ncbi:MAG: ATP-grasp domain-containing protein [Ignavibacteriales bacterium]|nr:ATP-grasp domain-containing protein [Ignavibacteriales bacterium]
MKQNNNNLPVLILSGHAIALGVIRSLGSKGVPVYVVSYDTKDMAYKSKFIQQHFVLPHPEKNAEEFIAGLLRIHDKIGKALVFPADDPTLVALSKNIDLLKAKFIIASQDWSIISKVINKDMTYAVAEKVGVPFPKTLSLDETITITEDLIKEFRFPCLVKPVQSHIYFDIFKSKMAIVNNIEELKNQFEQCKKYSLDVTLQEIIEGDITQGLNFNSLIYNGKIKQGFTAYKVRMTDNGYGIPVIVRSREMIKELWDYSEKLLSEMGYEGYSNVEFKYDKRDGLYKLLEVNGRYNRSSLLSAESGINFPWIQYNYIINGIDFKQNDYEKGFYYVDEFKDFQEKIKKLLSGKENLLRFLKTYFSKKVFAIFYSKDMKPFYKHFADGLKLLFDFNRIL